MIPVIIYLCVFGGQQRVLTAFKVDAGAGVCELHMNEKVIGSAQHDKMYCAALLDRVKGQLKQKGYTCTKQ